MWVVAARRDARGVPVADPGGTLAFPLAGRYRRDSLIVTARDVNLTFTFGDVPLRRFEFRGQLGRDLVMRGPNIYGEVTCRDVPVYGDALGLTGLCNRDGTLVTTGTYLTRAYDRRGRANRRPSGVRVTGVNLARPSATADGLARARFALSPGRRFRAAAHLTTVLLTDARTGLPVSVDYRKESASVAAPNGDLAEARVRIPAGTRVPGRVRAHVIADAFPLASRELR